MLPGIIQQINLDWSPTVNYYIPTLKRFNKKLWDWLAPNGPQLGGVRMPGEDGSESYWRLVDLIINPVCTFFETSNWDTATQSGKFIIPTIADVTINPPKNITAWWWVDITSFQGNILQEARLFSTEPSLASKLARQYDANKDVWSDWHYAYAQYSV